MSTDKKTPRFRLPVAIMLGLTLFSGVVHGVLDGRWSQPENLIAVGAQLQEVPERVGDWELIERNELQESAAELLRCYGSIVRVYKNQNNGVLVNVAVMYGPRGPIAVHTPEVCYDSVGTKQVGATKRETILAATERHGFWSVQFAQEPYPDPNLEVWYAWSDGGNWKDSDYPRFWMTENLYKIQVAGPVGDDQWRPIASFLEAFVPKLQERI
ncbi:MAG: exosortase-associated EpsI family protein [Planctomycetaceae bacterium]|nr:exosortase-associated EpsI family protein [Planctomycetaceae bacterium]